MIDKSSAQDVTVERTRGSVFVALGYGDPEEAEIKSGLVTALNDALQARGLTPVRASEIVGLDEPALADLLRGRTRGVSATELTQMLDALERDATPRSRPEDSIAM